jgi:hypothetical protein
MAKHVGMGLDVEFWISEPRPRRRVGANLFAKAAVINPDYPPAVLRITANNQYSLNWRYV